MFGIHDRPRWGHGEGGPGDGPHQGRHDGCDDGPGGRRHGGPRREPGRRDGPGGHGGPGGRRGRGGPMGRGPMGGAGPFGGPFGGPGGFGPGFGRDFGRGGPGGPGGRGRRPRGDVRLAVLALLREAPMHGYQIIQEIGERSGGSWRPSPGSVYPTVSQLADEGLVHTEKADGRTIVELTEEGRRHVEEHAAELDAVWTSADDGDDGFDELRTAGRGLMGAVAQVAQVGGPAQVAEAGRLLDETRRRLYLLLAGEDSPADAATDG